MKVSQGVKDFAKGTPYLVVPRDVEEDSVKEADAGMAQAPEKFREDAARF